MDELFEAYGGCDVLEDDENTKDSLDISQQQLVATETPTEVCKFIPLFHRDCKIII